MRPSSALSALASLFLLCVACGEVDNAPVGELSQPQLSGGPGVSIYNFVIAGERVGTVLVTDGVSGDGYVDQYEYWRWDPTVTDALRDGDVDGFVIKVALRDDKWTVDTAPTFEAGTQGWTAFTIPRSFELQSEPRWAYTHGAQERYLFEMTAPAWGDAQGDIRYLLEMDFQPGSDIPSMTWLVDADDIKTYYASEDSDEDADEDADEGGSGGWTLPPEASEDATRWEVRLTHDAPVDAAGIAWAYELTTLYPPQ